MKHLKNKAGMNLIMINVDKWLERDIDELMPELSPTNEFFYNNH